MCWMGLMELRDSQERSSPTEQEMAHSFTVEVTQVNQSCDECNLVTTSSKEFLFMLHFAFKTGYCVLLVLNVKRHTRPRPTSTKFIFPTGMYVCTCMYTGSYIGISMYTGSYRYNMYVCTQLQVVICTHAVFYRYVYVHMYTGSYSLLKLKTYLYICGELIFGQFLEKQQQQLFNVHHKCLYCP